MQDLLSSNTEAANLAFELWIYFEFRIYFPCVETTVDPAEFAGLAWRLRVAATLESAFRFRDLNGKKRR
jgi:hypothetical protein